MGSFFCYTFVKTAVNVASHQAQFLDPVVLDLNFLSVSDR